ncbi:hypothetical protein KAI32_03480 [Candidatus Pacearchaeota archaeon]|nr:hypothetical protein [Candidatus Pacearchaeota archaeon]
MKHLTDLSEWRKIALAFSFGVLVGTVMWNWLVPWLISFFEFNIKI